MKLLSASSFLLLSLNGHAAAGSNIRGSGLDKEQDRKLGLVALEHFIASDSTEGPQLNKLLGQARASNALSDEHAAHGLPEEYRALTLGEVDFPVSTTNQFAQEWFRYGLLQLFSFGYDYATLAFQEAKNNDPSFALAYAFEALCEFNPLWSKDDTTTSNIILDAMDEADTTAHQRELMYIDAIRAHFNASSIDKEDRHTQGVAALRALANEYPDDATAFAFMGLWRIALAPLQLDPAVQSATIAEAKNDLKTSLELDPTHPAALHYTLHAYDTIDATIAAGGLEAAVLYPEVSPDASHGTHMPMHILFRFGDFAESYDADLLALRAADLTCALYELGNDVCCDIWNLYHSVEYLQIEGYNSGLWKNATAIYERMEANYTTAVDNAASCDSDLKLWWMRMRAREFVKGDFASAMPLFDFSGIACPGPVDPLAPGTGNSHSENGYLLARALCTIFTNEPSDADARAIIDETKARMSAITDEFGTDPNDATPYYVHLINKMHVHMVNAADYFAQSQMTEFHEEMQMATEIEDESVTEWTVDAFTMLFLSAHELYGYLLMNIGDNNLALEHFTASVSTEGPQMNKVLGQARASNAMGDEVAAHGYYQAAFDMLHEDSDGADLPFWGELQPSPAASFTLPPDCVEPNVLRARVWVPPSLVDFLPSQNYGTTCPLTYRLVDSDGNTLAEDTSHHWFWGLTSGTHERSAWMQVDLTGVQALEIKIGCKWIHDAVLLGEVKLECSESDDPAFYDMYSVVEEWGEFGLSSKAYCLSTDPNDLEGWEDKVYDQECPDKYCFGADGSAQPCASEA